ncbi:MAG: beta-N-acetylglucosaminidase domain-containing protein [Bdellovibrionales bacterium]|nr:beta-N-acetylglucosaminidase domain-containing protein [Bdellovibrionales bacterium]
MTNIGIVEGFFGPEWSHEARLDLAPFLQKYGGSYYIYAPKRDAHLRKAWREQWQPDYLNQLTTLRNNFHQHQLKFGVALSPFGLGSVISSVDWSHLKHKLEILSQLKIDYLGLFFDDMPVTPDLLRVQTDVVELAYKYFPKGLIFCPSYYTFDPILDKVFGERPKGYVEGLKDYIRKDVDVCWTGPRVISEEISRAHLEEVRALLGRKPFIWENIFANDGPRNCKFLKLKYFTGRDDSLVSETSSVGFNLMNQPYLSQILFLASYWVMTKNLSPQLAFENSCHELCSPQMAQFIIQHRSVFLNDGLDKVSGEEKINFLKELASDVTPVAMEMKAWLKGEYLVGPECLTD